MTFESFPAMLRRLRNSRGWSQERLAEALREAAGRSTVTRQEVYRWESSRRVPKMWLPYLASVLGVPRETLEQATTKPNNPSATLAKLLPEDSRLTMAFSASTGRRVGHGIAERLHARVHALRLADDVLAGHDLLGPAFRELGAAVELSRESMHTEAVGHSLMVAVGELAQIAGWIASDAGQHERAEETYRLGLSAAREAEDGTLAGQLAGSLAYQWSNTGRETEAVTLAEAALTESGSDAPPRARALFWDRLAWAHTKTGNAQATMRALGEATEALSEHAGEDEPAWLYWVDAGELQVMEARAYTELRRPLRAVPLLADVLSHYNIAHTRELALYLSWLAIAYADANEPEQAAEVAQRMLEMSTDIASERTAERGRVVLATLEQFRDVPEVREVLNTAA